MTTVIQATLRQGRLMMLGVDKFTKWVQRHKDGVVFDCILDDGESSALTPMARKYFALRDEYADLNGYSKPYAHTELKHLFGVTYPYSDPPKMRLVRLVDAYGEREWQLSVKSYTSEELRRLVDGCEKALAEAGV